MTAISIILFIVSLILYYILFHLFSLPYSAINHSRFVWVFISIMITSLSSGILSFIVGARDWITLYGAKKFVIDTILTGSIIEFIFLFFFFGFV